MLADHCQGRPEKEGDTSFSGLLHLPLIRPYNVAGYERRHGAPFLSLGMTQPGIDPQSPGLLANTPTIMPKGLAKANVPIFLLDK